MPPSGKAPGRRGSQAARPEGGAGRVGTSPPPRRRKRGEKTGQPGAAGQGSPEPRPAAPDTPPAPADGQPDEAPDRFSRRNLLLAAGGGLASAVVGAAIAEMSGRLTSPGQAVRDDRAVEAAKQSTARQKPPLSVNAYYYDRSVDAMAYLFAQPLTADQRRRVFTPPSGMGTEDLLVTEGGIRAVVTVSDQHPYRTFTRVRLSVVGQWTGPVFVTQIRARVRQRSTPLAGAFVFRGSQGGEDPLEVAFDLDEPDSVARVLEDGGGLGAAWIDRHSLTLSPGEPLTVDVQAQTDRSYCEWVIELDVALGGERRVITVDDDGRPFRSTALARHYQERYHARITGGWRTDGAGPPEYQS
ncbi:hypothetical protein ACH4T9_17575 [Micromonospora sp. NPDC020750]|uniref:hypothetical protein n=1 Tax=unclassified Micromonospora TaxID=2617518 RepID=UPI00378E4984